MPLPWDYSIGLFSRQLNLWEYVVDLWQNRLLGELGGTPSNTSHNQPTDQAILLKKP